MQTGKLNEHVEQELFDKKKRVTTPKIKKEIPTPPQSEPRVIKEGDQPVKKKKPYYRKKYNKPTPVEIVPEPINNYLFIKGLMTGLGIAGLLIILVNLIF